MNPLSVTAPFLAATPTALPSTSGSQSSCRITASRTRTSASVSVGVAMAPSSPCLPRRNSATGEGERAWEHVKNQIRVGIHNREIVIDDSILELIGEDR